MYGIGGNAELVNEKGETRLIASVHELGETRLIASVHELGVYN